MPTYESFLWNRLFFVSVRYGELVVLIALLEEHPDYEVRKIARRFKVQLPRLEKSARFLHERWERRLRAQESLDLEDA